MRSVVLFCAILILLFTQPVDSNANQAPVANAGEDVTTYLGDLVMLNGSATDPDDQPIMAWQWTIIAAPTGSLAQVDDPLYPVTYFIPDLIGEYQLTLEAFDGLLWSEPDTCVVTIGPNLPPSAVIVVDKTSGPAPLEVHFDGSQSSDPEGLPLTYGWEFGDFEDPSNEVAPSHLYVVPGLYKVQLTVFDNAGQYGVDFVDVTVTEDRPPVANAGEDVTTYLGDLVMLNGSATDPDDQPIMAWQWTIISSPSGSLAQVDDPLYPVTYFIPDLIGEYQLTLKAFDGLLWSEPDTCVVTIGPNLPPTAVILVDKTSGPAPLEVHFDASQSSDPEGLPLDYVWDFGEFADPTTDPTAVHTYILSGVHRVQLLVFDNANQWDTAFVNITVTEPGGVTDAAWANFDPNTLNLGSNGKFITGRCELPEGYEPGDVDVTTVTFMGQVPCDPEVYSLAEDYDGNGVPDCMFKFDRAAIEAILPEGDDVPVAMFLEIPGVMRFAANDVIRVIRPRMMSPNGGESLTVGAVCDIEWQDPAGWNVESATLLYSPDGGVSWTLVADGLQGNAYAWTVPVGATEEALVRVLVYDHKGAMGYDTCDGPFTVTEAPTGVNDPSMPGAFALRQNVPNPFNPQTEIRFDLPAPAGATLCIYNVHGQRVRTLVDEPLSAGPHTTLWDGRDDAGTPMASGVYFYVLRAGASTECRRMVLLK